MIIEVDSDERNPNWQSAELAPNPQYWPDGSYSVQGAGDVVTADLMQMNAGNVLDIGRRLWGTLTSQDAAFFDKPLAIPQLVNDGGLKSGAALGCMLRINIPLAAGTYYVVAKPFGDYLAHGAYTLSAK